MSEFANPRHLLAALEVSRRGSISDAARHIHLSQPALTQAITKLERDLGAALFSRTATGVRTTVAGEVFLARVARSSQWLKAIEQLVASQGSPASPHLRRLLTGSQLRALLAVVDTGSYTRAAARLKLTQPTVHRAVRDLESISGLTLFRRSPSGVEPSWVARQLARHASLFFAEIDQGIEELKDVQGVLAGTLAIGALPFSRTLLVPRAVNQLLAEFPGAKIGIVDGPYEEQLHALLHGQLDVIVGALRLRVPSPDIVQELLFSDPLSIIVDPDHWLATSTKATVRQLQQLRWIAPRENTPARDVFSEFFRRQGLEPPVPAIECSSLMAIRGLLMESSHVALLPAKQVEVEVNAGLLSVSPLPLQGTFRDIGITLRKDWQPTRIQGRFLSLLRAG